VAVTQLNPRVMRAGSRSPHSYVARDSLSWARVKGATCNVVCIRGKRSLLSFSKQHMQFVPVSPPADCVYVTRMNAMKRRRLGNGEHCVSAPWLAATSPLH
jgi:hypothetical protein